MKFNPFVSALVIAAGMTAPTVLFGAGTTQVSVRVVVNVPLVSEVEGPAQVPAPQSGSPGGKAANTRDMDIRCSPEASGPQTIALVYTLMPR